MTLVQRLINLRQDVMKDADKERKLYDAVSKASNKSERSSWQIRESMSKLDNDAKRLEAIVKMMVFNETIDKLAE